MMMMQSRMESEQRERQYRNESEQREHEYQLCQEEKAVAREDACMQRQKMNMMFIAMINKNSWGTTATHQLAPEMLKKYFNV